LPGEHSGYVLDHKLSSTRFQRVALLQAHAPWKYVGRTHEVVVGPQHLTTRIDGISVHCNVDGQWRSKERLFEDMRILQEDIEQEPDHTRHWFYLAQTFHDLGMWQESLDAYRKRVDLGGWAEEVFWSQFRVGVCLENLTADPAECAHAYAQAFQKRPTRAEPLWALARRHRMRSEFDLGRLYARAATELKLPTDMLMVDEDVYRYKSWDELSLSAYYAGHKEEAKEAIGRVFQNGFPESERKRLETNRDFIVNQGGMVLSGNPEDVRNISKKLRKFGFMIRETS
jgi:hypothetical protein